MEVILATAFGRQVDIQKGESDDFCKAFDTLAKSAGDGEVELLFLFSSKLKRF